jgi:ABC-type transporter Mla MlaB component
MTATAKKANAGTKTAKGKRKSAPAPVRKAPRARKTARTNTVRQVETLPAVATVANDEVMMHPPLSAQRVDAASQASAGESDDRIVLPARMEMASLDEAHQLLQSKYPPLASKYILDGGLLSVIDSAGVQMLVSFIRSMTAKGCTVEWDNYSVQMYQLASELGVASQLGD